MRLLHYTNETFELEPRNYVQHKPDWRNKPPGLWVSVEGDSDWKSWCEAEEFHVENLKISYEVVLREEAKILHLKTPEEIVNLCVEYPYIKPQWRDPEGTRLCRTYEVDWEKMQEKYQGIVIAPYQWKCRLNHDCNWYYGWDCASGCIWDLNCIKEFKLVETK